MSLQIKVRQILNNFEQASPNDIMEILKQFEFHSMITQDYLAGKLKAITDTVDESEKKKMCKQLKPYFDWYLQGL